MPGSGSNWTVRAPHNRDDTYGALQTGFKAARSRLVTFRRLINAVQWQMFIPMFCAPVEWSPPKFEAVDPQGHRDAGRPEITYQWLNPCNAGRRRASLYKWADTVPDTFDNLEKIYEICQFCCQGHRRHV